MLPTEFAATQATNPARFQPVLELAAMKTLSSFATTLVVCLSVIAAIALSACGGGSSSATPVGGGGGGGDVTPPAPSSVNGVKLPSQVSAVTAN
jgi:hypothetical protein